jgi:hypothetical protein
MQDDGEGNMFRFDALDTAGQRKLEDGVELRSWTHSGVNIFSVYKSTEFQDTY